MAKLYQIAIDKDALPRGQPDSAAVLQRLEDAAASEEDGRADIADSMALLRQLGWLDDDGADDPVKTAARLRQVGAANLPVGRLWEGHMNALYLAHAHASEKTKGRVANLVRHGALLGVWGADSDPPVVPSADGRSLTGAKGFASGLGTVTHAVLTVSSGPGVRLGLVDVTDPARADLSGWQMLGMRATASGRFDASGIALSDVLWLGDAGDYLREPHFIGGVWRIAALQVGGALGLLDTAANALRVRGRLAAPAQMARLSDCAIRALAASALVTRAAQGVHKTGGMAPPQAAALSAAARLVTEEVALDAIRTVEQSIGLSHFEAGTVSGRKARDLSVYLRQAARDALQTRVGEICYAGKGALWTLI